MPIFRIHFKDPKTGKTHYTDLSARAEPEARKQFQEQWSNPITGVINLTAEETAGKVANLLLSFANESTNPTIKKMGIFSKPISAVTTVVLTEYKHHFVGDDLDTPKEIATRIWNHLISK